VLRRYLSGSTSTRYFFVLDELGDSTVTRESRRIDRHAQEQVSRGVHIAARQGGTQAVAYQLQADLTLASALSIPVMLKVAVIGTRLGGLTRTMS
jgi:hypothetical protein